MFTSSIVPLSLLFGLAACADAPAPTALRTSSDGMGAAKGGGQVLYGYSFSGDIASALGAQTPTAQARGGQPFSRVTVANMTVTLGAPSGNVAACKTGDGVYDSTFGQNAGMTARGSVTFHNTGTVSFLGESVAGAETLQFSAADATGGAVQSAGPTPGSYTYALTDARLFFGSNSTHFDGMYRCVNITVTATP